MVAMFKKWDEFLKEKMIEEGVGKSKEVSPAKENEKNVGVPMDDTFRDESEYRKLLDFIKGKGNVPSPVKATKETPKGWFVVDEATKGFWVDNGWQYNPGQLTEGVIDSERAANALAKAVHGIVVPAEEIL